MRHAGNDAQHQQDRRGDGQGARVVEQLGRDLAAHVLGRGHPGDDDRGRGRQQQRRDLGDQAVTDGQQRVVVHRRAEIQAMLAHADGQAADDVDDQDQDAGDRIAADELAGTVHRAVEVGLAAHFLAPRPGLVLVDQAGVQVGVDGHLLARHRVQGEARR